MKWAASILVVFALLAVPMGAPADSSLGVPVKTDRAKWFRDEALRVAFAYNPVRWVQANAAENATRHVVNWLGRQSGGLVATCYLQAYQGSNVARLPKNMIHPKLDQIVHGLMANAYKRDPKSIVISKEATFADNYPVVLLERRMKFRSLDLTGAMTLVGLFTAWRGYEILLECGYPDVIRQDERAHVFVRDEIKKVLRTLHFER